MNEHSVPQQFIKRLHETIAWCVPRVNSNDPKYCLRSAELRPEYKFDSDPGYDVDIWATAQMIDRVVASRSQLVSPPTLGSGIDLAGGRLLIHFLDESNHNGATADETSYFLDNYDTPPWDTWVEAFIPETLAHQSPDSIPTEFAFLISWVPPQFLETVHEATEIECVGMLMWADELRTWDGPRNFADSIPAWLEQIAPPRKVS